MSPGSVSDNSPRFAFIIHCCPAHACIAKYSGHPVSRAEEIGNGNSGVVSPMLTLRSARSIPSCPHSVRGITCLQVRKVRARSAPSPENYFADIHPLLQSCCHELGGQLRLIRQTHTLMAASGGRRQSGERSRRSRERADHAQYLPAHQSRPTRSSPHQGPRNARRRPFASAANG